MSEAMIEEFQLLGSMLIDRACIKHVRNIVSSHDLTGAHSILFDVMCELEDASIPFEGDITLFIKALNDRSVIPDVGGLPYVAKLVSAVPSSTKALYLSKLIKGRSLSTQLQIALNALYVAHNERANTRHIATALRDVTRLNDAKAILQGGLSSIKRPEALRTVKSLVPKVSKHMKLGGIDGGWSTGWVTLNPLLRWEPGKVTLVTAATGAGKSTFVSQAALYQRKQGRRVLFCPFEGGPEEAVPKLFRQMTGEIPERQGDHEFMATIEMLGGEDEFIMMDHHGTIDPEEWLSTLRYALEVLEVNFVVVDNVNYMTSRGDPDEMKTTAQIVKDTVELTKKSAAHTLIVSQASQQMTHKKNSDDFAPQLKHIKGLSSIIQDCQNAISIYRPRDVNRTPVANPDGTLQAALTVLKNRRTGVEGNINLRYISKYQTFEC